MSNVKNITVQTYADECLAMYKSSIETRNPFKVAACSDEIPELARRLKRAREHILDGCLCGTQFKGCKWCCLAADLDAMPERQDG